MKSSALFVEFDAVGSLEATAGALWSGPHLRVEAGSMHPSPRLYHMDGQVVVVHGHPIANGRREDRTVLAALAKEPDLHAFARSLDGSFLVLIHDPGGGTLSVINDRFAGFPLHIWRQGGRLVAGIGFRQVLQYARAHDGGAVDADNVLAFLWLRRLLGEGTFARDVSYLRAASILNISVDGMRVETYWQPSFETAAPRGRTLIDELAQALRQAVVAHMSDDRRFGLLLSGGLDSRALLVATPHPPECFTTCLSRNNEYAVAAEVACLAGASHHFLPRSLAIHDGKLDEATELSGMQIYNEAQFLGYGPQMAPLANVVLIGLGLDIFFGGLYLPKVPATLAGREALHHRLLPLPSDMAGFYLDAVKYRLKTSDPCAVMTPVARAEVRDRLRTQVEAVLARGRALGAKNYALWEYMHIHNMSRHYSFPMMASVRTFAECRAPALSNRLFDLALIMDCRDKLDGTPYQRALASLSPAVMAVRNANTNLPAAWSLRHQTWAKAIRFGLSRLGLGEAVRSPGWRDRSWPSPRVQLDASPQLMERVRSLPQCPVLAATGVIDPQGVATVVKQHIAGAHDHTILLNVLLTLSSILRPAESR